VDPLSPLPEAARRTLERAVGPAPATPERVRIAQTGLMWTKPGGRAMRFEAEQRLAVREVAFRWRARFPLLGPLGLRVEDRYAAGEGALEVRLGVPLSRDRGPEIALGQALRYLAELPWVPHAIGANPALQWRETGPGAVEVATAVGAERAALAMEIDADGDVLAVRCDARPRKEGKRFVPRPWSGTYSDHADLGGVGIPTRAEVRWELPEGPFVYWRGTVTALALEGARSRR
jgi:uncharacterized protein DUF6544